MKTLRIMGVHGLGDHRTSPWKREWEQALQAVFPNQDKVNLVIDFISYDDIFEGTDLSFWQTASAVGKLVASGIVSSIDSLFSRRRRGLFDSINHVLRWYAGYVVAWVESESFQRKTRERVYQRLLEFKPDVLLAHSLGSLVTYNALSSPELADDDALKAITERLTYVTLGSQIGNPFIIRNLTPGRIDPLDICHWFHLYNREDDVFTAPIRLFDTTKFTQVETYFDIAGMADHDALEYLRHNNTFHAVWLPLSTAPVTRKIETLRKEIAPAVHERKSRRRALLIGINDYPAPEARLDGCVNDVFEISSVLQECQFESEDIRVCLNDRATAEGIRNRMQWLLDDPKAGDELVFYFSGHGAQLPTYGQGDEVDRMDETLVPHDFDWSPETCITDDVIYSLYSQLPYDTRLVMIFDCCHSGGIHRSGAPKARGIDPPDDIRHRALKWNSKLAMWEQRELPEVQSNFGDSESETAYCGPNRSTLRLGRAMMLRNQTRQEYAALKRKTEGPVGPYLPVIIQACAESQFAFEYRHGQTSYGAFTYTLCRTLRSGPSRGRTAFTFSSLVTEVKKRLKTLNYDQTPQILGPGVILKAKVPWTRLEA